MYSWAVFLGKMMCILQNVCLRVMEMCIFYSKTVFKSRSVYIYRKDTFGGQNVCTYTLAVPEGREGEGWNVHVTQLRHRVRKVVVWELGLCMYTYVQ